MTPEKQKLYWIWAAMIQRCENLNDKGYKRYGAKGVGVCRRWRESFRAFVEDMGPRLEGKMLERIDSRGSYSPDNCRWATRQEQNENRPSWCHALEIDGIKMNLKQAWARFGHPHVSYRAVKKRIAERGWPVAMALLLPFESQRDRELDALSEQSGLLYATLYYRIKQHGWTIARAISQKPKRSPRRVQ